MTATFLSPCFGECGVGGITARSPFPCCRDKFTNDVVFVVRKVLEAATLVMGRGVTWMVLELVVVMAVTAVLEGLVEFTLVVDWLGNTDTQLGP